MWEGGGGCPVSKNKEKEGGKVPWEGVSLTLFPSGASRQDGALWWDGFFSP